MKKLTSSILFFLMAASATAGFANTTVIHTNNYVAPVVVKPRTTVVVEPRHTVVVKPAPVVVTEPARVTVVKPAAVVVR